ncbi:MAG: Rid family hydrolase [Candidatus Hodarchaeota archaeon]
MVKESVSCKRKQVLSNLKLQLKEAGTSEKAVVKPTLFLKNIDDFTEVNEV